MARAALVAAVAVTALALSPVIGAGEKYVVYGADTTAAERQELGQLFGVDPTAQAQTVTGAEMAAALQGTGLQAAPSDPSISSSVLTCGNKGDGLTVRTQNITRITAPVYANALLTAGVGDGQVLIAAPQARPVTGEAALVGVLKSFPQCQAGKAPDANRVKLAYQQIAWTSVLAGPGGDLNKAGTAMTQASQQVITGKAMDDSTVGQSLDQAAAAQGIAVDPGQRPQLVQFLRSLSGLDYGTYAQGFTIQQVDPNQVRLTPAGAGAPATGSAAAGAPAAASVSTPAATVAVAAPAAATVATAPAAAAAAPAVYTGDVTQAGQTLTVHTNNQDRQFAAVPGVAVTRDGKPATVAQIQKGDRVTVATNPDGSTSRIDATSVHKSNNNAWWLLLLPLLMLLGLLALLVARRRRDSFVLEPNSAGKRDTDRAPGRRIQR